MFDEHLQEIMLSGAPGQVGRTWGEINRQAILQDLESQYLVPAREAALPVSQLARQADVFRWIADRLAPHWLVEAESIAAAAGVDAELYTGFIATVYRRLFLGHECTSYATHWKHNAAGAVFFHKNRDNVRRAQSAFIVASSLPGVNRFLAISDASVLAAMMMVNEKGLAGSADTGGLAVTVPRFRGLMNPFILRHIAETASTCREAGELIGELVGRGEYAGGGTTGTHWLFVDAGGEILEVSHNSDEVELRFHEQKVYFSARQDSAAARALEKAETIDFPLFHGVSRDPSICFQTSISGMSVEIHRQQPQTLTCAWVSLPAKAAALPLFIGQRGVPRALLDGAAFSLGADADSAPDHWRELAREMHVGRQRLEAEIAGLPAQGKSDAVADRLGAWSGEQARRVLRQLESANRLQNRGALSDGRV